MSDEGKTGTRPRSPWSAGSRSRLSFFLPPPPVQQNRLPSSSNPPLASNCTYLVVSRRRPVIANSVFFTIPIQRRDTHLLTRRQSHHHLAFLSNTDGRPCLSPIVLESSLRGIAIPLLIASIRKLGENQIFSADHAAHFAVGIRAPHRTRPVAPRCHMQRRSKEGVRDQWIRGRDSWQVAESTAEANEMSLPLGQRTPILLRQNLHKRQFESGMDRAFHGTLA